MARREKNKSLKRQEAFIFGAIVIFLVTLVLSTKTVYAYYHNTEPYSILANYVGDFDNGSGDINIKLYKQTGAGRFTRIYTIPTGYNFDDTRTDCTITCDTNTSSDCYYSYDSTNREFSLTSNEKVTCRFYFVPSS